jgi:hypothetical protein
LKAFREGEIQVLVSSDAMTRGMDVEGVRNVINYDVPPYVKTYIHRAGRTARAGQTGCCFSLLHMGEVCSLGCVSDWGIFFGSKRIGSEYMSPRAHTLIVFGGPAYFQVQGCNSCVIFANHELIFPCFRLGASRRCYKKLTLNLVLFTLFLLIQSSHYALFIHLVIVYFFFAYC